MLFWATIFDLAVLLLAAARLSRLIVTDELGRWLLRDPLTGWAERGDGYETVRGHGGTYRQPIEGWRTKLVSGLYCPWCVGFWIALACSLVLHLVGGPGFAPVWWRVIFGALALNWAATVLGAIVGDYGRDAD